MAWVLPSLTALRTFEAAARHMSFTNAANELHLTQSAVSRQIRGIEDMLGVRLFDRVRQRLVLTDVGRAYLAEVRLALERMQSATLNLLAHRGQGGVLNVATQPAFGMKWLIPRLGNFTRANPDVLVNLVTRAHTPFDFSHETLDAAIHYGSEHWPGAVAERLDDGAQLVVCAPGYRCGGRPLRKPEQLREAVLLQHTRRPDAWREWFSWTGMGDVNAWAGPRYEHYYMIVQAAAAGMGVALLPRLLVQDDLAARRLVVRFGNTFRSMDSYYFAYPEARRSDPRLKVFSEWIRAEASVVAG